MADKNIVIRKRNQSNTAWENLYPVTSAANVITIEGNSVESKLSETSSSIQAHESNLVEPHRYEDAGSNPDFAGVKYRLVVINGKAFMEVVEA